MRFTSWETPPKNFTIGCYEDFVLKQPVSNEIKKGTKIKGQLISAGITDESSDFSSYTILFVPRSQKSALKKILVTTSKSNTLVISEQKNGAQMGAILNVLLENGKLVFEVNRTEAKKKGITINSKILKLAKKVF